MKKLSLVLLVVGLLVGCTREPKFKIGEKVTNGICTGYVTDIFYEYPFGNKYKVEKFACAEIEFTWAVIYEGQLKSAQQ